ncbi:threonine/homoserine/homoserine lactone efflux protein [Inhella inkyongensis]|uniref:Threonine/homoserine/homoserine lactone efflux protein n=1 Tax=Inhella inkyongensis TaxID=392593 RepID=A0A840S3D3_9BURK|nr:LysE family translocator [Inhella inkyongensis]MBB5205737.1 threonine/homoserine/homoserine lactone efflux protein [Inhella inkyongensis]
MSGEVLLAFCLFACVSSVTPGPNNLMVLASGVNHGFRASIPHVLGIGIGFGVMLVAVGLGLGQLFERWPLAYELLKWLGAAYLVYLAWAIARSGAPELQSSKSGRPMTFLEAAAFQWVNPKAWIMAVGAFSTYVPGHGLWAVLLATGVFVMINIPSVSLWAWCGSALRAWMAVGVRQRLFNLGMALLLLLSLVPLFLER